MQNSKLEIARTKYGMSQERLAELIGLKRAIISAWERGTRDMPVRHAKKISKVFGCDWKDLYE